MIVTVSVSVRYTASGDDDDLSYGPTDTRIISLSNALCEKVKFTSGGSTYGYEMNFYTLSSPPKLTGRESFSLLNERPDFSFHDFQYYYYYMPKGSNLTMSACVLNQNQPRVTFYMIKGNNNFKNWKDDYGHSKAHFRIDAPCGSRNNTYSYSVTSDDFYYLVFDAERSLSNALNVSMYFDRTQYEVDNSTVIDYCSRDTTSIIYQSCSLGLPLSGSTVLLQVAPAEGTEIDWKFEVYVDVGCSARIWMYFVISLCVLIGVVGILVAFFVFIYFYCIRKKTTGNTNTLPANLSADAGTKADDAPLLNEMPPPVNPNYPQSSASSDYGTAPPPYKA